MEKNYFVYHLHTELSLQDSCTNHKLYADKASELGQKAICYSEHGNIYCWIEKKLYANSRGLKYIHGCEVYLTEKLYWDSDSQHEEKYKIRDNYHTVLVAKNYEGVKELNTLISKSTDADHRYYSPRITFEEFFAISDNVFKISACMASPLNKYPESEGYNQDTFDRLLRAYDFYEIQPHVNENQIDYNKRLYDLSLKYGKPLIAGTDTHSLNSYKAECRKVLKRAKKMRWDDEDTFDLTYKSYDELVELFRKQGALPEDVLLQAIENTNLLESQCEDFELDYSFKYPVLYDDEEEVLWNRIRRMYKEKVEKGIISDSPAYMEQVKEEMRVFKKISMIGFMLFMSELCCWCWENGIPIGPCRGSVGGSMVAYLTDIIDVDPLKWDTIFFRFANESRKEIGDIDLDISPSQREMVYNHIIERFGNDKTAYILAIGTISEKGTIDEVGRGLSYIWDDEHPGKKKENPYSLDIIARIKKDYEANPQAARENNPSLFYYFDGLLDTAISQSMHPAGIVVSPVTLPDNYGTFWSEGKQLLCINMEEIHEVSLVKYDILGLKSLEVIKDTCEIANIKYPKANELNWEDKDVWKHITDSPVGIFQFESTYAYRLLKQYGPKRINDLSLVNASLRPSGESYRDRLIARETNHNPSELIDELLKQNNGFLVYQEDTLKFLMNICGMEGSEADNVRRAIGRKQKERLEAALPQILEGYCSKSDKPRKVAEDEAKAFLQIIEDSANYQFGYNHSTGYSMIGYMCGYLRHYYPKEFITAYLNNANNDADTSMGTELAKSLGIQILPIKFRKSSAKYTCGPEGIYKGIGSIKNVGNPTGEALYNLRNTEAETFLELLKIIKSKGAANSKQMDILIKLDFFSEYGDINTLLEIVKIYGDIGKRKQFSKQSIGKYGVTEEMVRKHSKKETEKIFKEVDTESLMKEMIENIELHTASIREHFNYEVELLGYPTVVKPGFDKRCYIIYDISQNKAVTKMKLHEIYSGKTRNANIWNNSYERNPFANGDMISIQCLEKRNRREPSGEINPNNGKMIYVDVPGEYEYWLKAYSVIRDEY